MKKQVLIVKSDDINQVDIETVRAAFQKITGDERLPIVWVGKDYEFQLIELDVKEQP